MSCTTPPVTFLEYILYLGFVRRKKSSEQFNFREYYLTLSVFVKIIQIFSKTASHIKLPCVFAISYTHLSENF